MNNLVIPSSPNWYESRILACSVDNTVVYGTRNEVVVINPAEDNKEADVKVLPPAHYGRIISVDVNQNWCQGNKLVVSAGDDKVIHLWNVDTCLLISSNRTHTTQADKLIGSAFMGTDKIVSASECGFISLWRFKSGETTTFKTLFTTKIRITALSACPHVSWMAAFGLQCGLVVIADLRKFGRIVYKLRGHDKSIVSLSWCPTPFNIFPPKVPLSSRLSTKPKKVSVKESINPKETSTDEPNFLDECKLMKGEVQQEGIKPQTPSDDLSMTKVHQEVLSETTSANMNETVDKEVNNAPDVLKELFDKTERHSSETQVEEAGLSANFNNELNRDEIKLSDDNDLTENKNGETTSAQTPTDDTPIIKEHQEVLPETTSANTNETVDKEVNNAPDVLEELFVNTERDSSEPHVEEAGLSASFNNELNTDEITLSDDNGLTENENRETASAQTLSDDTPITKEHQEVLPETTSVNINETADKEVNNGPEVLDQLFVNTERDISLDKAVLSETQLEEATLSANFNNELNTDELKLCHDNGLIESDAANNKVTNEFALNYQENPRLSSGTERNHAESKIAGPAKEYLLASSARGGSIFIWRAGTDGRKETEFIIGGNKNKRWRSSDKSWISLCWIAPDILLSSSPTAQLLQWDLLNVTNKKKLVHHDHNHNLFAIAAPVILMQEWNRTIRRQTLFAWTTGQERYLLNTSLQADRTILASYPTIGGNVYTIRSSPLDPTRLAIGIGDNTARVWELSRPHKQYITMANLWQKIQSKVFALTWHPQKEVILAYATDEGRIGIVNTSTKNPSLLPHYFRNAVYDIHWGPIDGNKENLGLYAVGEGKLVLYDTSEQNEDPQVIECPAKEHIHCLAWKADFSLLACGTKTGSIIVYDISLNHIKTIYSEYKSIYCIVWHPLATSQDEGTSPMASWLALSSSSTSIVVFDVCGDQSNNDERNRVAVLNRHTRAVRCLSWNPYVGGRIVSGGDDGVIFVWDVRTEAVLATYTEHNLEPVLTVLWSPLNENFVISAGKDNCIRIWNITEHKPKSDEEITGAQKGYSLFRYERKKLIKDTNEDTEDGASKVQRQAMLKLTSKTQNSPESTLSDCVRLFNTLNSDENMKVVGSDILINGFDVLKMFGDKNSVMDLLNAEEKNHEEKKKFHYAQHLELWKGDVPEMVRKSIARGHVSPWLISLAPMVSPELWKEACEVYTKKLMEDATSDPIETVSYLLICHKIEEAIEVLCNATLFREALVLAKCRLSKNDPVINEILKKWATFGILNGAYEISTQCFIALGQYEEAAKALFRRTNIDALKFSLTLAEKSGNKDLIDACFQRHNSFKNAGEGDEKQNGEVLEKEQAGEVDEKGDLPAMDNLEGENETVSQN